MPKQEQSAGDDGSTLALKPVGRVNRSPKQRAPVDPQNGDLSPQKIYKEKSVDILIVMELLIYCKMYGTKYFCMAM